MPRTTCDRARVLRARSCSSTCSASSTSRRSSASTSSRRGWSSSSSTSCSSRRRSPTSCGADARFYWRALGCVHRRARRQLRLRRAAAPRRRGRATTSTRRARRRSPAARARSTSTARSEGSSVYRPNALTGDPNHLGIMLLVPLLVLLAGLPPARARPPLRTRLAVAARASCSSSSSRRSRAAACSGSASALLVLALPYRRFSLRARCSCRSPASRSAARGRGRPRWTSSRRSSGRACRRAAARRSAHFDGLRLHPGHPPLAPAVRPRANNFSVYYEFVTGKTNWGPHSFYVALLVETGLVGAALFGVFLRYLFARLRRARRSGAALAAPARWPRACGRSPGG